MKYDRRGGEHGRGGASEVQRAPKIGASTLVQALGGDVSASAGASAQAGSDDAVHAAAAAGVAGGGGSLPHLDAIQRSFGRHDVSGVEAHVGGGAEEATRALGAEAYATGNHVAFGGAPSLHTAAHEAAHVVQQRGGVQLKGGVGAAGDAHEQHADAVADLVVQGRSAEGLLDPYAGGAGGAPAVQRQPAQPGAGTQAIVQKLDALAAIAFDAKKPAFDIDTVTAWMDGFLQVIGEAKAAAGGAPPAELVQAVDRCVSARVPALQKAAEDLRAATVQATNDSSVAKKDPAKATLPTQAQAKKLADDGAKVNQLSRDAALPAGAGAKTTLQTAASAAQDAALAVVQAISVAGARERWKTGSATETPSADKAGTGARKEIDDVFQDSGWNSRVSTYENDEGKKRVYDWCGMFVVSSLHKSGGLAKQLRAGFYHTDNVQDFFKYEQLHNAGRAPKSIWAEGQWWNLKTFHETRGSARKWTPRATIQAALAGGGAVDIRPGDTCLIDHDGGNSPSHIVMVESYDQTTKQLVTIEGNTYGIHADKDGKAERVDDATLKKSAQGSGTAAGVHVRDLRTLAPGPGKYVVTDAQATVREDENLSKVKTDGGKKVIIPADSTVDVTEIKESGGKKYAKVDGWGWTLYSNLGFSAKPPDGAYKAASGATVWGVGRPSIVDFEDGHDYAVDDVPAELKTTSPDGIRELAKKKGKEGAAARKVDIK